VANREATPQRWYPTWARSWNLAWELDFWGRFRRAIESAEDSLDASIENYDDVLVILLGDVADAYVQIRTLQQRIGYLWENVRLQKEIVVLTEAKLKGGEISAIDTDQAKSDLAQFEAQIPPLEIAMRQQNDRLCVLLGVPVCDLVPKLGPAPIPTAPVTVGVGIPCELLTRRPDVRRAERQAAAQCAQIGVAVADLYPAVSITGTIGGASEDFARLFDSLSFKGTIGPSFQWNILNYGRILSNIKFEEAKFQELVAAYQQTVLNANSEVEDGLVQFLKSQRQVKSLLEANAATLDGVRLARINYKEGTAAFIVVARYMEQLVQIQDNLAQAEGNVVLGLIHAYRALGGGWQIRLEDGQAEAGKGPGPLLPPQEPEKPQVEQLPPPQKMNDKKPEEQKQKEAPQAAPAAADQAKLSSEITGAGSRRTPGLRTRLQEWFHAI
jgi:NodT family efflux transporter outer membrane factor (OMF) lipoprotein